MFPARLRSKRIWIPSLVAVVGLGVGGTVWASAASADNLGGSERDRVVAAAKQAAGPGEVVSAESSDRDDRDADDRNEAYEVELRKADGTEVDVTLDKDLNVLRQDTDDDAIDTPDTDDRALSSAERSSAEKAALSAVGGGTVVDLEAGDDRGEAYEVEVRTSNGAEWDVTLDSEFKVLDKVAEN